jgi:hypothetical protein
MLPAPLGALQLPAWEETGTPTYTSPAPRITGAEVLLGALRVVIWPSASLLVFAAASVRARSTVYVPSFRAEVSKL